MGGALVAPGAVITSILAAVSSVSTASAEDSHENAD